MLIEWLTEEGIPNVIEKGRHVGRAENVQSEMKDTQAKDTARNEQ